MSREEIKAFVSGFTAGSIPDEQAASWLMSIFFQGMNNEESSFLTEAMLHSGEVLDFSQISARKVDKHSTGGVGDKASLLLAPIVAAAGVVVPMISGRGLGHTGGTLDKLESIPGFSTSLNLDEFRKMLETVGVSLIGQTREICPADKKLYALRDVTGTVESLPLICSSIMSKKLAEGIDGLVLDVKFGSGAFMKNLEEARELAEKLISIGKNHGKEVAALLTSMEQPLGRFVGNALEIRECLAILKQENLPTCSLEDVADTIELSLELAGHMIYLGKRAKSPSDGIDLARKTWMSGEALRKFEEICRHQGGDLEKLPEAAKQYVVHSQNEGYLAKMNTESIGMAALLLGAGRKTQQEKIDPSAGIELHAKIGSSVAKGDPLFTLHSSKDIDFGDIEARLLASVEFSLQNVASPSLIRDRLL